MTNPAHVRLTGAAATAFVLAFVAVVSSDVDLDSPVLVVVLLGAAIVRLMMAAQSPAAADGGDLVSNRIRAGILMFGFIGFLIFSQALRDLVDGTASATVGLGLLYTVTTLFVTRRTQQVRIFWLALAATVIAMGVGADLWWLVPLAASCAFAASGNFAESGLPTLGTATTPASGPASRRTIGKALGFALVAALIALWWQPKSPPNDGPSTPGDTPLPPATTLVPVTPVEDPTSPPWLLFLLLLLLVLFLVLLALLLWRYLRRRRQPWSTRALRRFTKAGHRLGVPLAPSDTLHQFAQGFPDVVGDLPTRIANSLDSTTYSRRSPIDLDKQVEPELQSLERLAKAHQRAHRRDRLRRVLRRPRTI